ncbi:MAG: DUF445 family protein [Clostridia bacterium]|nr:DUF445 family protein [Clostridia bacterium]
MGIRIVIPLLVGAVIGFITNDIAIKMLFHPRKALYIGTWRVPFTPGLIPKQKDRVARSIGTVISTQLLNSEVVLDTLTSDSMVAKVRGRLEGLVEENQYNEATVEEALLLFSKQEVVEHIIVTLKSDAADLIYRKLAGMEFGEQMSKILLGKMKDKMNTPLFSLIAGIIDDEAIGSMAKSLGELIDRVVEDNSEDIIRNLMDVEIDKIKNARICELIEEYQEKIPKLIDFTIAAYKKVLTNNLKPVLEGINLAKIVEDRVASFDVIQLENMIFGIMDRELKAIVYLGALLGFLMGIINIFV